MIPSSLAYFACRLSFEHTPIQQDHGKPKTRDFCPRIELVEALDAHRCTYKNTNQEYNTKHSLSRLRVDQKDKDRKLPRLWSLP